MRPALLAALLWLGACDQRSEPAATAASPSRPAAASPAPQTAGYVGRWAASPDLCASGAWVFAADRLVTAGEVACEFQQVTPDARGWTVAASCTAEAPPAPATLRLERAGGGALAVSGGPFQPVTLRLCAESQGTATVSPTNP